MSEGSAPLGTISVPTDDRQAGAAPAPTTERLDGAPANRPLVSVVVLCWNERDHLDPCLRSLLAQTYRPFEIVLVDNGSTDGSAEYVEATYPEVRVVRTGANLGYAGGNNRGLAAADGDLIAVANPDTEADPRWLEELVAVFARHPGAGLATSLICYFDDRERINTSGNGIHVSGAGFCLNLDRSAAVASEERPVPAVSGCSFMIRRAVLEEIGGLDEAFFIYVEDTDLSIRAALAGHELWYAPRSIIYHKYAVNMVPRKFFRLERNRWQVLLKNLGWPALAALGPALALGEALSWTYAATRGPAFLRAKAASYRWLLRHLPALLARRRAVQALRRVDDATLLASWSAELPAGQLVPNRALAWAARAAITPIFAGSLALARSRPPMARRQRPAV